MYVYTYIYIHCQVTHHPVMFMCEPEMLRQKKLIKKKDPGYTQLDLVVFFFPLLLLAPPPLFSPQLVPNEHKSDKKWGWKNRKRPLSQNLLILLASHSLAAPAHHTSTDCAAWLKNRESILAKEKAAAGYTSGGFTEHTLSLTAGLTFRNNKRKLIRVNKRKPNEIQHFQQLVKQKTLVTCHCISDISEVKTTVLAYNCPKHLTYKIIWTSNYQTRPFTHWCCFEVWCFWLSMVLWLCWDCWREAESALGSN